MKSFKLEFPKTKMAKIITTIVVIWFVVLATIFIFDFIYPKPMSGFQKDIKKSIEIINEFNSKNNRLPTEKEYISIAGEIGNHIKYTTKNGFYYLEGWDGNNRWKYLSDEQGYERR